MHSSDLDGTTIRRTHEETGRPRIDETRHFPAGPYSSGSGGGRVLGEADDGDGDGDAVGSTGGRRRIEDVADPDQRRGDGASDGDARETGEPRGYWDRDQADRDREYEERIEDEYAKREGGA